MHAMNSTLIESNSKLGQTRNTLEISTHIYIRKGRKLQQVTPAQCAVIMDKYRGNRGASEMRKPHIDLHNQDGEIIGQVSYNGRAWLFDEAGNIDLSTGERGQFSGPKFRYIAPTPPTAAHAGGE